MWPNTPRHVCCGVSGIFFRTHYLYAPVVPTSKREKLGLFHAYRTYLKKNDATKQAENPHPRERLRVNQPKTLTFLLVQRSQAFLNCDHTRLLLFFRGEGLAEEEEEGEEDDAALGGIHGEG